MAKSGYCQVLWTYGNFGRIRVTYFKGSILKKWKTSIRQKKLINEIKELRRQITGLKKSKAERKQAEAALQESEEIFRSISTSAQDGIVMMDNEGNISYWNKAAQRIFDYTEEEAIGKETHIFLAPQ